jgi:hypothetical protein
MPSFLALNSFSKCILASCNVVEPFRVIFDVLRRMAFHYLEKSLSQKSLEQIRQYLSRYGKEKSVSRDFMTNAFTAGIHCGTNYTVLSQWVTQVIEDDWFCDDTSVASEKSKIVWKPTAAKYEYEFVFHQAEIGDDVWKRLEASGRVGDIVVGCSFHPKPAGGFFKKI